MTTTRIETINEQREPVPSPRMDHRVTEYRSGSRLYPETVRMYRKWRHTQAGEWLQSIKGFRFEGVLDGAFVYAQSPLRTFRNRRAERAYERWRRMRYLERLGRHIESAPSSTHADDDARSLHVLQQRPIEDR